MTEHTPQVMQAAEEIESMYWDAGARISKETYAKCADIIAKTGADDVSELVAWCDYLITDDPAHKNLCPDIICPCCGVEYFKMNHSKTCGLNNLLARLRKVEE